MNSSTQKAYVEVIELLKFFSAEQVKNIPMEKLKVFLKYKDENYNYKVEIQKQIELLIINSS